MAIRGDIIERANARLGHVLKGKWHLDAVIGIGGMASVYSATHRNQARVAIKLLHAEVALDAEVTARFLREGYVANAVGHPGTVTVLDDDVSEDQAPFLVMELLIGQTLDTMLAMAPDGLSAHEVLPLIDQLLDVLIAAHDKGIVHRDIKPENLFLTTDGRLKVLDFGIARLRELSVHGASGTQAGSVLGTPAFMAPEQALGRWHEVDGRTDIWAVGATAFTLLTGAHVHEAETLQEQLVLSATCAARRVRAVAPGVPEDLAHVVDRALSFARSDRFSDARAMRAALRLAATAALGEPPTDGPVRATDSAHASKHEQHDATLIAPLDVTSAITGRVETATTGRPVTRHTVGIGGPRPRSRRFAMAASLALLGAVVALLAMRQRSAPPLLPAVARQPTVALRPAPATALPPAVAPVLDATGALPEAPVARGPAPKPRSTPGSRPVVRTPAAPGLSTQEPTRPVTAKSLVDPDNPFDRRH